MIIGLICGPSGMSFAAAAAAAAANNTPLLGSMSAGIGPIQSATLANLVAGKWFSNCDNLFLNFVSLIIALITYSILVFSSFNS